MELVEYADAEMMMMALADRLASELRQQLQAEEAVTMAVPGGTTPGPVFDVLSGVDLDWGRVRVVLTDERWVPEDSPRSNAGLVRRRLLQGRAAAARFVPLANAAATPEEGLGAVTEAVAEVLPLSVCLLGMGEDMHTASIFPGADRLAEALTGEAPVVAMRAAGAAEPRVTLSARVLNGAMRKHLLIIGPGKRAALERARGLPPEEAPVAAVLRDMVVHWAEA